MRVAVAPRWKQFLKQTENQPGGREFCSLLVPSLPFIYNLFLFGASSTWKVKLIGSQENLAVRRWEQTNHKVGWSHEGEPRVPVVRKRWEGSARWSQGWDPGVLLAPDMEGWSGSVLTLAPCSAAGSKVDVQVLAVWGTFWALWLQCDCCEQASAVCVVLVSASPSQPTWAAGSCSSRACSE